MLPALALARIDPCGNNDGNNDGGERIQVAACSSSSTVLHVREGLKSELWGGKVARCQGSHLRVDLQLPRGFRRCKICNFIL